jgi:hypothetical protein
LDIFQKSKPFNFSNIRKKPGKLYPMQIEVVDDQMAEVLKGKTPAERLRIGFNMWISVRKMLLSHIAHSHPDWSRQEVEREVARRLLHGAI